MAPKTKIRPEQLIRAKKLLHDLPERKDGKSGPEAAAFLESDFRKALKKGYSPKELSLPLKNENIIIPAYLIQKFCLKPWMPLLYKNRRKRRQKHRLRRKILLSCRICWMRSYEHEHVDPR